MPAQSHPSPGCSAKPPQPPITYASFGYEFDSKTLPELNKLVQELHLKVDSRGPKTTKPDLIFALERFFALERVREGTAPTEHLQPSFDVASYTKARIRQVLAQHNYKYVNDNIPAAHKTASHPVLKDFLRRMLPGMRDGAAQQASQSPPNDPGEVLSFENLSVTDATPSPSSSPPKAHDTVISSPPPALRSEHTVAGTARSEHPSIAKHQTAIAPTWSPPVSNSADLHARLDRSIPTFNEGPRSVSYANHSIDNTDTACIHHKTKMLAGNEDQLVQQIEDAFIKASNAAKKNDLDVSLAVLMACVKEIKAEMIRRL